MGRKQIRELLLATKSHQIEIWERIYIGEGRGGQRKQYAGLKAGTPFIALEWNEMKLKDKTSFALGTRLSQFLAYSFTHCNGLNSYSPNQGLIIINVMIFGDGVSGK